MEYNACCESAVIKKENPFKSFWMGGYECSDKINAFGNRVDLLTITGHLQLLEQDYKKLSPFNIATVREGIRWSQVEKEPYHYDWRIVKKMIVKGKENDIQQVWDLCHFGFPDDLTPLHPMFPRRFAAMCKSFAETYRSIDEERPLIITPINEVSFLSWLGGEACGTSPFCNGIGWQVKYKLMKAYIEGIQALKQVDSSIRILTTEPLINIVASLNAGTDEKELAATKNTEQFQVLDILSGNLCSELGGKPEYLDIIGINYYYNNQWTHNSGEYLSWKNFTADERSLPLHRLIENVYKKYHRPVVLAETSHSGEDRAEWIKYIGDECATVLDRDIPLWGICLYPLIDRPDWDDTNNWHQSGLWDDPSCGQVHERILNKSYAKALLKIQLAMQERREQPVFDY